MHESSEADGSLIQSNPICPVILQNTAIQYPVIVSQIDSPDTKDQVVSGLVAQDLGSESGKTLPHDLLEDPHDYWQAGEVS